MAEAVWLGVLLGVGAALSIGPISLMIVHEALTRGLGSSLRVILGSAVADVVLLLPALLASWLLGGLHGLGPTIALLGAAYFVWLGLLAAREGWRLWRGGSVAARPPGGWSFARGVLGNLLNPSSWVFWLATGTPTMLRIAERAGWPGVVVFTIVWFGVAMAVEASIALVVAQTRKALTAPLLATFECAAAVVFVLLAASLVLGRGPA